MQRWLAALGAVVIPVALGAQPVPVNRPEIIRTAHGVPHIYAADFEAAGYGLAWVQLEDYGNRIVHGLIGARGEMGRIFGRDSMEGDFSRRPIHAQARVRWMSLEASTREMYQGFAAGVNDYIRSHPTEFAPGIEASFAGWDILAREMNGTSAASARRAIQRELGRLAAPAPAPTRGGLDQPDDGSNAWALAPSRTASRKAILLRNPHLAWDAGYYEAHVVIPNALDFYGDFRIGTAFAVVGGFNRDLGWATTNNDVDTDEIYAAEIAPGLTDQILLDGRAVPLIRTAVTVEYRNGAGYTSETRDSWTSPIGPVVERAQGRAFVVKAAGDGEHRGGEMFLRMMRARTLAEWQEALRLQARASSNLTYADRAGNIFYVWNGTLPALPHRPGGDSIVFPIRRTADVWGTLVPFDSMPQVRNPPDGYVHNENSSPHFTNLKAVLDTLTLPPNVERPSLSLRSQLALELIAKPGRKLTLEDVVRLKHSYRMLLADRVKPDLLALVASTSSARLREAGDILQAWDNTVAPTSRGGVLFEMWWRLYSGRVRRPFAEEWSFGSPTTTPRGLADPVQAVEALAVAADSVRAKFGRLDIPWGDVHRVRIGSADLPVGGCHGALGCFRVLWFKEDPDGKRSVQGGDGWILAVEFGDVPRAYSVLAYGESNRPESPWHQDQAAMFAKGELKPVAFLRADVERTAVRRYRAGDPDR